MRKKSAPKPYHHGDLRTSILGTADSILAAEGISALSMREVARLLNVSHGAPYRHFIDKEAILAALALEGFEELLNEQERLLGSSEGNAREKLKLCASAYLKFAATRPHRFRMMFEQFPTEALERLPKLKDASSRNFKVLTTILERAQAEGSASRTTPAPQLALVFWSTLYGFIALALGNGSSLVASTGASLTVLQDLCIDSVLKGLAP